jgi:superfamily II DNA/RNA helicase
VVGWHLPTRANKRIRREVDKIVWLVSLNRVLDVLRIGNIHIDQLKTLVIDMADIRVVSYAKSSNSTQDKIFRILQKKVYH